MFDISLMFDGYVYINIDTTLPIEKIAIVMYNDNYKHNAIYTIVSDTISNKYLVEADIYYNKEYYIKVDVEIKKETYSFNAVCSIIKES